MNILLTLNSAFVRPALVLMESLYVNHSHTQLEFYVVHSDLTEDDRRLLSDYCVGRQLQLHMIKQDGAAFAGLRTSAPFPAEVYFRMLAHIYTPESVDRVLYLDADVLCNGSLQELYHMDFEGNYLIACSSDPEYTQDREAFLRNWDASKAARGKYFNSGVLLINCRLLREKGIGLQDYLEAAGKTDGSYLFDQGLLNLVFSQKTLLLPSEQYNYRYGSYFFRNRGKTEQIPPCGAKLIHFAGEVCPYKPWDLVLEDDELEQYQTQLIHFPHAPDFIINRDINDLCRLWWDYAKRTEVYPRLLLEMQAKKEWFKRGIYGYLTRLIHAVNTPYFQRKAREEPK